MLFTSNNKTTMGEKLNSLGNTAGMLTRIFGTAANTGNDLLDVLTLPGYNFAERMGSRSRDIKEAVINATNTGPQRKRRIRRPLAKIVGAGSYMTGALRAGGDFIRDTVGYTLHMLGNTFNNLGTATLRMGKKDPVGSFSFAKLQPENVDMKSYVMSRRFPALTTPAPTPAPVPVP